ncbi:hypothetical protein [Prevotella sp. P5-108]|uniref:hypothetical protein n=1 Tax=Prevotella sp. P5-108 TaxID=2024225 RepID=UPI001180E3FF|nr:hypothetical protein [Prevotella sp. P5-108]
MNNYLRWLVAVLFATVCNLGYAQSNEPEVTLDFTLASNPWQLKEGSYEMNKKAYTYDGYTIEIEGSHYLNKSESTYFLQCQDEAYVTLPKFNFTVSRIVLEIYTPANALKNSVYVGNKVVVAAAAGAATCDFAIPEGNQSAGTIYKIHNTGGAVSRIKQIKIYGQPGSAKTPTSISFDGLMGEGITLTDGKTSSGEVFTGYQAVEKNSVPGKVSYETSGDRVAEVDASTGAVVVHANVYGTMTITATFQPEDKEKYASSTAQYTITNKRVGTYAFHESFDQCDGKEGWYGFAAKGEWDASKMDNVWKHTGTVYLGSGCIRIGPDHGSVTTPVIRVDGSAVLTFKAAMWKTQNEQTDVVVTISDGSLTYGDKAPAKKVSVTPIKAQWTDYEMVITGTGEFTLTFANVTNSKNKENNRFFLDEVTVTESAAREITLNEEKANVIETEGKANVTLRRTLYDDGWNTLCLPFSLSEAQAKLAFGDGVELRELEKVEGTTLIFKAVKGLTAGVPCLIRPSRVAEDNTYTFSGVQTTVVTADSRAKDAVGGAISFTGIYSPVDVTGWADSHNEYVAFLGAGNKFFRALSGKPMKAFRAFFIVPETTSVAAVKAVIDGTTTAIGELNVDGDKTGGRVYNLNGQCVGTSLDGLQPGIYIRHGRKVIITK